MATLKTECFDHTPATWSLARLMVFDYLETFYTTSLNKSEQSLVVS